MKNRILICVFLLSVSFMVEMKGQKEQKAINWMEGTWVGMGFQIDGQKWDIQLNHSNKHFKIEYPSLGCSGFWTIKEQDKSKAVFIETITKGSCDQGVTVVITKIDQKFITISYFMPEVFPNDVIACSVLKRKL